MNNSDHLYNAFSAVYVDMCAHGICRYDPQILAAMWASFLIDMAHGFPVDVRGDGAVRCPSAGALTMAGDGEVRVVCVIIEADADVVIDTLAAAIESAIRQATPALPKPEPTPLSRPENFPAHLYPRRRPTAR